MTLIVVESPTKARTFNRILKEKGGEYEVFATVGHFRDIPSDALHINYGRDFQPDYTIKSEKQKVVDRLTELASKHGYDVILATDEDREGESIAYHIAQVLGYIRERWPDFDFVRDVKRIVFHEITSKALMEALDHPTALRSDLVKAQQARRILDRIVGYEVSPLLWKKLGKNWLSAGRVQSVGLRLIVEREREIQTFTKEQYYQIYAVFTIGSHQGLRARLISHHAVPFEVKTKLDLFAGTYEYVRTTIDSARRDSIQHDLSDDTFTVSSSDITESSKYPPPPYSTSLLQIDAYQKLRYPSKLTMKLAQTLYERGLITYHRTDSFNLSSGFVFKARDYIAKTFGAEYALEKPRGYKTRSRGAQQAHEAIRPTRFEKVPRLGKGKGGKKLSGELLRLYTLIFERAIATQMAEAKVKTLHCQIMSAKGYLFERDTEQIVFDGFLRLLNPEYVSRHSKMEVVSTSDRVTIEQLEAEEGFTKPPPRYNDGSLVRVLEEKGIGRPSTYASIITNIIDKQYVVRDRGQFVPTGLGNAVAEYLSHAFSNIFELDFTAQMEDKLDAIEEHAEDLVSVLRGFYEPFKAELDVRKQDLTPLIVQEDTIDEDCPECGQKLVYKYGKFGKFIACSGYPSCKYIKKTVRYLEGEVCPTCGGRLVYRYAPKARRRFFGCENYPRCKYTRFTLKPTPSAPVASSTQ